MVVAFLMKYDTKLRQSSQLYKRYCKNTKWTTLHVHTILSFMNRCRSGEGIKRVEVEPLLTKKSRPTVKVGDSAKAHLESRIFRLGLV